MDILLTFGFYSLLCMAWLMVLERFPIFKRLYGRKLARREEFAKEELTSLGYNYDNLNFGAALLTSVIMGMAATALSIWVEW